jgi:hypothetical protein
VTDQATTTDRSVRFRRAAAIASATAGLVTLIGYLWLIREQGSAVGGRIAFFAAFVGLMALLAATGAFFSGRDPVRAQMALLAASSGFIVAGVLALFSIGAALLLAGALAALAIGPRRVAGGSALAIVLGILGLFVAGIALTAQVTTAV